MQTRRTILAATAAALAAPNAFAQQAAHRRNGAYANAIVIDAQGGPGGSGDPTANNDPNAGFSPQDLADVRASGVTAISMTVGPVGNDASAFEQSMSYIAFYEREIAAHPDVFLKVLTAADLRRAKDTRRQGLIYNFQDTYLLGPNLDRLDTAHNLGLRIIQLTYNNRNLVGDGCLEPANAGLSRFGVSMVEALNARRILVDLSHGGAQTIADGIAHSTRPPAITHTGCRALNDVPRNVSDENLRALAEKGGVAGIYFMPFLRHEGQPRSADVLAHIEHALNVCGEDHVGLGTDGQLSPVVLNDAYREAHRRFVADRRQRGIIAPGEDENVFNYVPDYNEPRRFEVLANDLQARGHPARRIEKILGGNFARLFSDVWG